MSHTIEITLNGEVQRHVIEFDTAKGTVTRPVYGGDGRIVIRGDQILTETVSGIVHASGSAAGR